MRRGGWRKSRAVREWQRRLPLETKPRKRHAYCANGFGMGRSDRCVKCTTGRADHTGRKALNGRRKHKLCRMDWIGICGSVPRQNVLSTMLTCPLYGGDGATLGAVRWGTWVRTVMTRFSAC